MAENIEIDFGNNGFKVKAELKRDGTQWCVGIGDTQTGIYGFADNPLRAVGNFREEFRNYKAPEPKGHGPDVGA